MGPTYAYLYLTAMRDEANTATFAYVRIEEFVDRLRELGEATKHLFTEDDEEDIDVITALGNEDFLEIPDVEEDLAAAIEAFLSAQTRLSLFVSPSPVAKVRARAEQRAAALRARLGLNTDDDLGDRDLRNAWMHIDESIDAYLFEKATAADLIVRQVGVAEDRQRVLRLIDPSGFKVSMLGVEYSLRDMHDWVSDIDRRLALALQTLEAELHDLSSPQGNGGSPDERT
jgi:hypothetical protein